MTTILHMARLATVEDVSRLLALHERTVRAPSSPAPATESAPQTAEELAAWLAQRRRSRRQSPRG